MDDVASGGFDLLPGDVQYLLSKRAPLTAGEARLLENFLVTRGSSLPPEMATMVGAKIGSAPTDWRTEAETLPTTPSPSVADQVGASMGMGVPASDPAVTWMQQQPGYQAPVLPGLDDLATLGEGGNALTEQPGWGDIPPTTTDGAPDLAAQTIEAHRKRGMPPPPPAQAPGAAPMPAPPTTGPGDDITAEAAPGPSGVRVSPEAGMVTPPQDFFGGAREAAIGTGTLPTANPLPDRGGAEDRRRGRDRRGGGTQTNWGAEREALGLSPDSAFAGVGENFMIDYASSPDLAARAIAKRLGGGAQTAALILPQVKAGMQLIQSGGFGGRRQQLGPGQGTPAGQLALLEEYVRQGSGLGTSIDPRATVRSGLKRASRTSAEELQAGPPLGEDPMEGLDRQITATHNALLSGAGQWGPGAAETLMAKLDAASLEWLEGIASGAIPRETTYPQYLRDKGARRWIR